jgi:hypothetical protein
VIGRDCRCPGCGTCDAASEVERLRKLAESKNGWRIAAEHRAMVAERERDEALAQVARREREHEALLETAQKALAHVEAERDEARAAQEESEHQMHLRIRSGYDKTIADSWRAKVAEVERERDELKARLDHAEADAEQAIHNEAFMERQRIVAWIRARLARSVMDDRVSIRERGVMADLAEGIDRGWHEAPP